MVGRMACFSVDEALKNHGSLLNREDFIGENGKVDMKKVVMELNKIAKDKKIVKIDNELREKLAELEHKQWLEWVDKIKETLVAVRESILQDETEEAIDIIQRRIFLWLQYERPYNQLSEEEKDLDKIWADKIIKVITKEVKR